MSVKHKRQAEITFYAYKPMSCIIWIENYFAFMYSSICRYRLRQRNHQIYERKFEMLIHEFRCFFVQNKIDWQYFTIAGSWLYRFASGSRITEIRIESCRKTCAQFHDGYTVDKTGKFKYTFSNLYM